MTNRSQRVKAETNFSYIIFFSFQFNLLNFCFSGVSICKDQGLANVKKTDKPDIGTVIENLNINTAGKKKANRMDKLGIDKADIKEVDRTKDPDIGILDIEKTNKVDKSGIDTSTTDGKETNRANNPNIDIAVKNPQRWQDK